MIFALAENIRSLYNVGALFRTAEGAGVTELYLTGISGCPPHKEIRKVALGAEENVPWQYHKDSLAIVHQLQQKGVRIVALETVPQSVQYDEVDWQFPLCLVVGNEYHGISAELMQEADLIVSIPMRGRKVSLNVAVAFGIAVYELARAAQQPR